MNSICNSHIILDSSEIFTFCYPLETLNCFIEKEETLENHSIKLKYQTEISNFNFIGFNF